MKLEADSYVLKLFCCLQFRCIDWCTLKLKTTRFTVGFRTFDHISNGLISRIGNDLMTYVVRVLKSS